MKDINLTLKVEDVNLVLTALGNLPFIQVHELIAKIQAQATAQLQAQATMQAQAAVQVQPPTNGDGKKKQIAEMESN
jgi:hypothetical protein